MANDGKIYITISDTRTGGTTPTPTPTPTPSPTQTDDKKPNVLADFAAHQFKNFIIAQAKQAVNSAVSSIGNFTGNYQKQQDIQTAISIGNSLVNIGTSFIAGTTMTGSPIGGAISAGLSVVAQGVNVAVSTINGLNENAKTNREISILRQRAGTDTLTNGNRTGN